MFGGVKVRYCSALAKLRYCVESVTRELSTDNLECRSTGGIARLASAHPCMLHNV